MYSTTSLFITQVASQVHLTILQTYCKPSGGTQQHFQLTLFLCVFTYTPVILPVVYDIIPFIFYRWQGLVSFQKCYEFGKISQKNTTYKERKIFLEASFRHYPEILRFLLGFSLNGFYFMSAFIVSAPQPLQMTTNLLFTQNGIKTDVALIRLCHL